MNVVRPAVTVVMPTHNRAHLLTSTLHSVLRQRNVDLRVVIVDDGSSDETPAVVRAIGDERVRWYRHEQPFGVSAARNRGLAMVDTAWVAFTDDDDLWSPFKVARQLEALRSAPEARWSYVGAVVVDSSLQILRHEKPPAAADLPARLLRNNCIPAGGSGVLASTTLVRDVGGFDTQLSNLADWDMWIRLALAEPSAAVLHPLVAYRVHTGGMAHGVSRTETELALIASKYADHRAQRGISVDWGVWYRYLARLQLRMGDQEGAAEYYFRAARAGQWTRYGVGMLCLAVPGLTGLADRRGRLRVPRTWAAEADNWLDELRHTTPPSQTVAAAAQ